MKNLALLLSFALFPFTLFISGCASLNSVSLTPIPAGRGSPVKVEKSKIIILGLNFDNDFVNEAEDDLKRQCPNGKVTGLLTKDENINYFLYLVYSKRLTATGYCVANGKVSGPRTTKGRGTASTPEQSEEGLQ